MSENPKIKRIKLGETVYDLEAANGAEQKDLFYTNKTPIVTGIGSIKPGDIFEDVKITEMLTKILYPYVDIDIDYKTMSSTPGTYNLEVAPTISSITFTVLKNSVVHSEDTPITFELFVTANGATTSLGTKTGANISDSTNLLVFDNLNFKITRTSTFKLQCNYTNTNTKQPDTKTCTAGTFTIQWNDPSTPGINLNLSKTSYYCGESAIVSPVVTVSNLNSTAATGGIKRIQVFKRTRASSSSSWSSWSSVKDTGSSVTTTSPALTVPCTFSNLETLSPTSGQQAQYKATISYYTQDITTGNLSSTISTKDSSTSQVDFTYKNATVAITSGISTGTYSKLDPKSISSIAYSYTHNSAAIAKLELSGGTLTEAMSNNATAKSSGYDTTSRSGSFTHSVPTCCTTKTFTLKALSSSNSTLASTSATMTFKAPYCWGFVPASATADTIDLTILNGFHSKGQTSTSTTTSINLKSAGELKFVYLAPNGNYSKVTDGPGNDNTGLFNIKNNHTITFADGSTETYQVWITKGASAADVVLKFE